MRRKARSPPNAHLFRPARQPGLSAPLLRTRENLRKTVIFHLTRFVWGYTVRYVLGMIRARSGGRAWAFRCRAAVSGAAMNIEEIGAEKGQEPMALS